MKKFFKILLIIAGVGALVYIVTRQQDEDRQLWDDILAQIPEPESHTPAAHDE